jgi:hypothetical protein
MAKKKPEPENLAEEVVPDLLPLPTVIREFKPAPWYRPRKQYLRKHQWIHETVEQIFKKRTAGSDGVLRVLGLPSSDYLDLLSMQDVCEKYSAKVLYLGFNSSYSQPSEGGPVDLYQELQAQRMIETSSFVHPSSRLVPGLFEHISIDGSMSRNALRPFGEFDVVNLDLCGCIVDDDEEKATEALDAIVELIRWQSTRRLTPWLFFVTTFASPDEINRPACMPLVEAIRDNADECSDFRKELETAAGTDAQGILDLFAEEVNEAGDDEDEEEDEAEDDALDVKRFIRIFALAVGKWLAARLKVPTPPALAAMLPGYCFRHKDHADPHLLSLGFLITPKPHPGEKGAASKPGPPPDLGPQYRSHARKMITKSFGITDLDQFLDQDKAKRREAADETEHLLVSCGFDASAVKAYLQPLR